MTEIALIGNPNSGKTSLFNLITGSNQRVGNWPGVTVERKSGKAKLFDDVNVQDLPGIYSMSPYSPEEKIARDYLLKKNPDCILNVVDATNLERNLYLTTQLIETGIPVIIALNMSDLINKQGKIIRCDMLDYHMGVPVVSTSAVKNIGVKKAIKIASQIKKNSLENFQFPVYDLRFEAAISQIIDIIYQKVPDQFIRFYAIKLFERDYLVEKELEFSDTDKIEINDIISITEDIFNEDAETIVINQRYEFIEKVCMMVQTNNQELKMTISDKIDRVVTSKLIAFPFFAMVMFLVYFLSIQTLGNFGTSWINDFLFGKYIPQMISTALNYLNVEPWLQSLVTDGILVGIGSVLNFLPQIFILFICLGILEDIGYMSRIAFVMDRVFRRFGFSGKSFIPMLISTSCSVPGIMASRTIENESDRRITIMTTSFMPCSAKLAIISVISGTFFPNNPWIAPSTYFLGMGAIILSGIALKKSRLLNSYTSPFIMELPNYHLPKIDAVLKYAISKSLSFIKRSGSIIFSLTVLLWIMSSYNFYLQDVGTENSMLASLGRLLSWLFTPLGFGNWRATVATMTGLIAKETIVATFGILYQNSGSNEGAHYLLSGLKEDYTALGAYSFLAFNLLCAPCLATIGAIRKEMGNIKWTLIALIYQTSLAYFVSFIIYQFGLVILYGKSITIGTVFAVVILMTMLYCIFLKKVPIKDDVISLRSINFVQD